MSAEEVQSCEIVLSSSKEGKSSAEKEECNEKDSLESSEEKKQQEKSVISL